MGISTKLGENVWNTPMDYTRARAVSMLIAKPSAALLEGNKQSMYFYICLFIWGVLYLAAYSYTIMEPEDFFPFVVPFQLPGHTKVYFFSSNQLTTFSFFSFLFSLY